MRGRTALLAALLPVSPAVAQSMIDPKLATLEAQARATPADADVLRRLAAAQAASGRLDLALRTIDRARSLAPDDLDIRLARARILTWSGRRGEARAEADAVAAFDPRYPELAEVRAGLAAPRMTQGAGLAGSVGLASVTLPGDDQLWTTLTTAGFVPIGARATASLTVEVEARRRTDTRFTARADGRLGTAEVHAAVTATPQPDFREQVSIAAGIVRPVARGLDASFDLHHARYEGVSVTKAEPGVRVRLAGDRIVISAKWINLFRSTDGHRSGAALRGNWDIGRDRVLFAGGADYPDTEAGVTRRVRAAYAGAALPVSDRLSLRLTVEYERRVASYTRRATTIGFIWRPGR